MDDKLATFQARVERRLARARFYDPAKSRPGRSLSRAERAALQALYEARDDFAWRWGVWQHWPEQTAALIYDNKLNGLMSSIQRELYPRAAWRLQLWITARFSVHADLTLARYENDPIMFLPSDYAWWTEEILTSRRVEKQEVSDA